MASSPNDNQYGFRCSLSQGILPLLEVSFVHKMGEVVECMKINDVK
ncbi:MAG: hypothetical protein ACI8RD_010252 [Bacillariaceae sp.]|jgi:hypothetical protein